MLEAMAGRLILDFLGNASHEQFLADRNGRCSRHPKTQSAVLYQLLVIAEAVKRLSLDFRSQHGAIPWSQMAGMRDHLIHAYDTVDWNEVWKTVSDDIPDLLTQIEPLLPDRPKL